MLAPRSPDSKARSGCLKLQLRLFHCSARLPFHLPPCAAAQRRRLCPTGECRPAAHRRRRGWRECARPSGPLPPLQARAGGRDAGTIRHAIGSCRATVGSHCRCKPLHHLAARYATVHSPAALNCSRKRTSRIVLPVRAGGEGVYSGQTSMGWQISPPAKPAQTDSRAMR